MNELPVKNPLKWDAEHPNLYTLTVTLSKDGKEIGRFDRRIGFRDVKIEKEPQCLVNWHAGEVARSPAGMTSTRHSAARRLPNWTASM